MTNRSHAGAGVVEVMTFVVELLPPPSPVTVQVMVCAPAASKRCWTWRPVSVEPSPKSQAVWTTFVSPPVAVEVSLLNCSIV